MEVTLTLYRTLLSNRSLLCGRLCEGAVFFAASTIAIFAAVSYATVHASNYVTDFILEPRWAIQPSLPFRLWDFHGLCYNNQLDCMATKPIVLSRLRPWRCFCWSVPCL